MSAIRSTSKFQGFDWDIAAAEHHASIEDALAYALRLTRCPDRATLVTTTACLQLRETQKNGRLSVTPRAFLMAAVNRQCTSGVARWPFSRPFVSTGTLIN